MRRGVGVIGPHQQGFPPNSRRLQAAHPPSPRFCPQISLRERGAFKTYQTLKPGWEK